MKKSKKKLQEEKELRLQKERVLQDIIDKLGPKKPSKTPVLKLIKKMIPLTITVGIIAAALYVYFNGWYAFLQQILTGVIWITLISTVLGLVSKAEKRRWVLILNKNLYIQTHSSHLWQHPITKDAYQV